VTGAEPLRVAFLGAGAFGVPSLKAIAREYAVELVVSQPDRPAGRGKVPTPTPVSAWAQEHGVPLLKTDDVNGADALAALDEARIDTIVVIAFGQKIGLEVLAGRFAVNLHGSLLPRWRGAAPIQRAVMAGDAVVGVSVISIAPRMDAGVVFDAASTALGENETAGELHDRLSLLGVEPLMRVLRARASGVVPQGEAQVEEQATRARKLSRTDAWVDVGGCARVAAARINGLSPWPGVDAIVAGKSVKLLRARSEAIGGELEVLEVQPAGGRVMAWSDFLRGLRWDSALSGGDPPIDCRSMPAAGVAGDVGAAGDV